LINFLEEGEDFSDEFVGVRVLNTNGILIILGAQAARQGMEFMFWP
jgi:hypothetical protein